MTDINEILKEYVTLDIECIDRIYLNGYIPTLQMGGQLVKFIHHRGYEIPSPAILRQWTDAYKRAVESFAQVQGIEIIRFEKGTRKEEVAAKYRAEFEGKEGVLFIGIAQERAYAFQGRKKTKQKLVGFEYSRQSVFVNHYYFYLQDKEFGPTFIKVCSYAPSMLSFLSSSLCIGEQTGSALVGRFSLEDYKLTEAMQDVTLSFDTIPAGLSPKDRVFFELSELLTVYVY